MLFHTSFGFHYASRMNYHKYVYIRTLPFTFQDLKPGDSHSCSLYRLTIFIYSLVYSNVYLRNIYWAQTISLTLLINIGGGQVGKSKVSPMLEKWTSKPRGMSWAGRLGSAKGWSFDAARSWCDWLYFLLNSSTRGSWSKVDFYRNNPDVHQLVHGETKRGLSYRDCYVWSCRGMKWRYVLSHGSCSVGEGSYETALFVRFHSFEMSRAGGSVETGSRATVAWCCEGRMWALGKW